MKVHHLHLIDTSRLSLLRFNLPDTRQNIHIGHDRVRFAVCVWTKTPPEPWQEVVARSWLSKMHFLLSPLVTCACVLKGRKEIYCA